MFPLQQRAEKVDTLPLPALTDAPLRAHCAADLERRAVPLLYKALCFYVSLLLRLGPGIGDSGFASALILGSFVRFSWDRDLAFRILNLALIYESVLLNWSIGPSVLA